MARVLKVTEDHHGFYEESMADDIHRILGEMLVEADPRQFLLEEALADRDAGPADTPVLLLNRAWQVLHSRNDDYQDWEKNAIATFIT